MFSFPSLLKTEDPLIRASQLGLASGSARGRKGKSAFRRTQIARVVAIAPLLLAVHAASHPAHAANLTRAIAKQDTPDDPLIDMTGTVDADAISESTVVDDPSDDPSDDTPISVAIVLPVQDEAALEAFVDSVSDPDNPNFRNYCTPDQFAAWFGPTDDLFDDVADYVEDQGLTVTKLDGNSNVVMNVTGTIRQIRKAFHVRIHHYHHNALNRDFFSAAKEPRLPRRIAGEVRAIIGLDNFARLSNSLTSSRQATKRSELGDSYRVSRSPVIISPPSWLKMATSSVDSVARGKRGNSLLSAISNRAPEHLLGLNALPKRLLPMLATAFDDGDGGDGTNVVGGNSPVYNAYTPMNIKQIYGLAGLSYTGTGQTIGLIEFNPFNSQNINAFCTGEGIQASASQITTTAINPPKAS